MSDNFQTLIQKHHAFYEVLPYYVMQQEQTKGATPSTNKIQAGFDIDVFGSRYGNEERPGQDYALFYAALENLVETVEPHTGEPYSIQVVPFPSRVVIDTKKQFQELGMLRIRIAHTRLDKPAGALEEHALNEIKERLDNLGLAHR